MMWQVRALLEDRPGALAALAAACGTRSVNILALQIFPAADGRVVDELVLSTPGGWAASDVEQLCDLAGVHDASVASCSPRALEDRAVGYLRAATVVVEQPELLEDQLARLLGAFPDDGVPGLETLRLDEGGGPRVRLSRAVAFTDTEHARAAELRRLAAAVLGSGASAPGGGTAPVDPAPPEVVLRPGTLADASAVVAMHARCSSDTVHRRYHAPMPRVSPRFARSLLAPVGGLSLVATVGADVVAIGMLAPAPTERDDPAGSIEAGLMVEDRWQRQGLGTRLLHELAVAAAHSGRDEITCLVQPRNDAVLRAVHRAGLHARVSQEDGVTRYRIPVARLVETDAPRRRSKRPVMGEVTAPLVGLLHARRELREVYPPADLVDQAVRGGA
jgi:GNAT superfamily N-acetyltransferase